MEQLIYDNTVSDGFFSIEHDQTGLSQYEVNQLMQQFMSSIELHKLASVFFQQLQKKLKLSAIKLQFASGSLTLGEAENSCNIKTLEFANQRKIFATAQYSFSHVLSINESDILNQLHHYFTHPLRHALEYYRLKQMATKDHLTGLGNRASYQETIHRMISQANRMANRESVDFGLLILDLDNFKQVNDTYGHQEGDKVLIAMADVLQQTLRETDYAFRFGGDEFCCLLPGSQEGINNAIAHRILYSTAQNKVLSQYNVSCSIGHSNYVYSDCETSIFERADRALYDAKNAGRSCIKAA